MNAARANVPGPLARFLRVKPDEAKVVTTAFLYAFSILAGYYFMRPVREAIGSYSDRLHWFYTFTFLATSIAFPAYSFLVARFPRRTFVAAVYRFFALNILFFWWRVQAGDSLRGGLGATFFVWLSVYNLVVVTLMWSNLADVFDLNQGKRLFGLIAGGGTLGAVCASWLTGVLVENLDKNQSHHLLLIPAVLLEVAVRLARRLKRTASFASVAPGAGGEDIERPTGGGILAGLALLARSPLLLGIAGYLFLATLTGTLLYFQQTALVSASTMSRAERTGFYAGINFWSNLVILPTQALIAARLMKRIGLGPTLTIFPALNLIGFACLGFMHGLGASRFFDITRRSAAFGVATPSREALFTMVSREEKYKAKSLIDTVVYRGGDVLVAWIHVILVRHFAWTGTRLAFAVLPLCALWIGLALFLGAQHRRRTTLAA